MRFCVAPVIPGKHGLVLTMERVPRSMAHACPKTQHVLNVEPKFCSEFDSPFEIGHGIREAEVILGRARSFNEIRQFVPF